jgi:hypothetical protein
MAARMEENFTAFTIKKAENSNHLVNNKSRSTHHSLLTTHHSLQNLLFENLIQHFGGIEAKTRVHFGGLHNGTSRGS